jgi:hypothetical protein
MKLKTNWVKTGQGILEYIAALVISILMVAGVLGCANQVMPSFFDTVVTNNESALSESEPGAPPSSCHSGC